MPLGINQEITAEIEQRFRRCAPAALKRRSSSHLNGLLLASAQMPLLGGISLVGLHFWDWSPLTLFAMLAAGLAANIPVCTLRWIVARRALQIQVGQHNDDRFVWAVAEALRRMMLVLNIGVIIVGFNALFGCREMREQAGWLREHLE